MDATNDSIKGKELFFAFTLVENRTSHVTLKESATCDEESTIDAVSESRSTNDVTNVHENGNGN